jgi:hypothetical protein
MLTSTCGARSNGRHRRLRKARLRECENAKTNPLNASIPRLFSSTRSAEEGQIERQRRRYQSDEPCSLQDACSRHAVIRKCENKATYLRKLREFFGGTRARLRRRRPYRGDCRRAPLSTHSWRLLVKTRCLWSSVGAKKQSHYVEQLRGFSVARDRLAKIP